MKALYGELVVLNDDFRLALNEAVQTGEFAILEALKVKIDDKQGQLESLLVNQGVIVLPRIRHELMKSLYKIEDSIRTSILSCYPRAWNEDHITYTWLNDLRHVSSHLTVPFFPKTNVAWDAYKMDGRLEENNGDVAVLVKITFENKNSLTGVAFLEAKRVYNSGRYESLKWAQLRHMSSHSSQHHLLLYDFEEQQVTSSMTGCCGCPDCFHKHYKYFPSVNTNTIVVPTLHALAIEEKTRALSNIGYRLSEQIFLRFFRGLDLDFTQNLVDQVKQGVAGGVNFLVVAHVVMGLETVDDVSLRDVTPPENSGFRRILRNNG